MKKTATGLSVPGLLTGIGISEAAGLLGSVFTAASIRNWYSTLRKPSFNPPGWIFGPVWTTLYAMMGTAASIVWQRPSEEKNHNRTAISLFGIQLFLNTLWSYLFFGRRSPLYAFVEILGLWTAILLTMLNFFRISRLAGALLVPYFLWTTFAAFLNFFIWRLNR